ncbi:MAG: hypothetical protein OXT67_04610 [Zetaproteobacteria bacterium]|nr:hypothetical protein [Zetaproteobacteria bacterium]
MSSYKIIQKARLSEKHTTTGKTQHFIGDKSMPQPAELVIAQYPDDSGYYLFYLDNAGEEMSDTFHDSLQSAIEQAKWEFEVKEEDWSSTL